MVGISNGDRSAASMRADMRGQFAADKCNV
jgi:hypothetical protein